MFGEHAFVDRAFLQIRGWRDVRPTKLPRLHAVAARMSENNAPQRRFKAFRAERLAEELVDACVNASIDVARNHLSRQRDDRHAALFAGTERANSPRRLERHRCRGA